MASISAARAGAEVTLIERTEDGGRKILIAGGGRCNVLPSVEAPERYVTGSSTNTLNNILKSWPLREQRRFFEEDLGIPLKVEEDTGKVFPVSDKARDIRDGLVQAARDAGVRLWFGTKVDGLSQAEGGSWSVEYAGGKVEAGAVILATGGLSVPKTGSDGIGLRIVRELGHDVAPTYPALTPLTADPHPHAHLAGVSTTVTIRAPGSRPKFSVHGGFLITHRGYSGPSVLNASHLAICSVAEPSQDQPAQAQRPQDQQPQDRHPRDRQPQELRVQWTPLSAADWDSVFASSGGSVLRCISEHLPARLASQLLVEADIPEDLPRAQLRKDQRKTLIRLLVDYPLPWTGDEGYKKAEVTGGGVRLSEINWRTMESRTQPGLFLCGEILDAFGPIGGYNFLWAWATGRTAGENAAQRSQFTPPPDTH